MTHPALSSCLPSLLAAALLAACGSTPLPFGGGGGAGADGGASGGGQADGGPSGGGPQDGGFPAEPGRIACGQTSCDAATQECCLSRQGATCAAAGQCPGTALACSSAVGCGGGQVCCLAQSPAGNTATCQASCMGARQLCASDAECANGFVCRQRMGVASCEPPPPDGGLPPPPPPSADGGTGLVCGQASCDPATQDCCVSLTGATCGARGSCTGSALSCTSPAACPTGQVCCASSGANFTISSGCTTTCEATGGGDGFTAILCATDADCPAPQTCSRPIAGVRACRPPRG